MAQSAGGLGGTQASWGGFGVRGPGTTSEVGWGRATAYGVGIAFIGGFLWGAVAAGTGYVFSLAAILIGLAVAWGVSKGARRITGAVIVLGILLTLFAVFIGDIVALSIIGARYGLSPLDILAHYPEIVALSAGDTLIAYVFGLFGAAYAGYSLMRQRKGQRRTAGAPPPTRGTTPTAVSFGSAGPASPPAIQRGTYDVRIEVDLPPPGSHRLVASYTTMTGRAEVHLDGQPVGKSRVWGIKKEIPVALPDSARPVVVRFRGAVEPHIDVLVDGQVYAAA